MSKDRSDLLFQDEVFDVDKTETLSQNVDRSISDMPLDSSPGGGGWDLEATWANADNVP